MKKVDFNMLDVDLFWIHDDINKRYMSGFKDEDDEVLIGRNKNTFITDGRYITQAKEEVYDNFDIIIVDEKDYYEQLIDSIKESGYKKIGFEADKVSYKLYKYLEEQLEGYQLIPLEGVIENLRICKDDNEVQSIQKAVGITEKTFIDSLEYLKEGMTEKQYANIVDRLHIENCGEKPSFDTIVAFGENSAKPHATPTDKKLKKGDIITLDFGCFYNSYCSDMTRTFTFGEQKNEELLKIHEIVYKAMELQIKSIRPGIKASEIDKIGRDYISKHGYGKYFLHATGHGVGLEIHEAPRLSKYNDTILQEGMAITIEPGIYLEDIGGVRIENLIIVTKNGYNDLNNSTRDINVIKGV